ncbi:MAG: hypothetical protein V1494_00605 [Candidatus Diapherotrites archaeon]
MPKLVAGSPFLSDVWRQVHRNKGSQIILVNGLPRTGKSELCLVFAHALDPNFSVQNNVAFNKLQFLQLVRKNNYVGAVNIWEEAGLMEYGASAREFWSADNRRMSSLFQSMGFHRQICIVNLPQKIMLDKHLRSLCHWIVETKSIDVQRGKVKFKVFHIQPSDKIFYKKYIRVFEDDGITKIMSFVAPRPPMDILEEYWAREKLFKEMVSDKLEKEMLEE